MMPPGTAEDAAFTAATAPLDSFAGNHGSVDESLHSL